MTPQITQMVANSTDTLSSIANFIVDNNPTGVYIILRSNGYTFNTEGEAAIIVRSILTGTSQKNINELIQLKQVPYLNDNVNGTGGINDVNNVGGSGGTTATNIGGLVCTVGAIFGYSLCSGDAGTTLTPEQQAAATKAAADAKTKNTIIIVSVIGVILIVIIVLFIKNKKKNKNL